MGNSTSTIELNGKLYDARTGKIVSGSLSNSTVSTPKKQPATPEKGQILDGFVRRSPTKSLPEAPTATSTPKTRQQSKSSIKPAKRPLEKSKTLMRPAVKKPHIVKNDIQPVKRAAHVSISKSSRYSRAEAVQKSPQISRFGNAVSTIAKKEIELPVITPSIAAIGKNVTSELHKLENALIDANAHLQQLEENTVKKVPFLRRVGFKNKFANVTALSFAMLLLIGFFGYQNSAAISMKLAASKAGVQASLPSYKPAGYGLVGGVESKPGKVSVSFKSRTDDKKFTITQQASSWNSASLLANHVTKQRCNTCFQTWQNDGKTVYIYDSSNATWVNGGVWYQIEGNADLTSDQLLRLASSL